MKIAVFASGQGSNFLAIQQAIEERRLVAEIVCVVSDHPDAPVIDKAKAHGIAVFAFNPKSFSSKAAYEAAIRNEVKGYGAQWLVLAGYMRIIGTTLLAAYPGRIVNIHPSLLPKYKGKDALGQALAAQETRFGVSVHYVDATLDGGPIIRQASFIPQADANREAIEAQLHQIEHHLYVDVLIALSKEDL